MKLVSNWSSAGSLGSFLGSPCDKMSAGILNVLFIQLLSDSLFNYKRSSHWHLYSQTLLCCTAGVTMCVGGTVMYWVSEPIIQFTGLHLAFLDFFWRSHINTTNHTNVLYDFGSTRWQPTQTNVLLRFSVINTAFQMSRSIDWNRLDKHFL